MAKTEKSGNLWYAVKNIVMALGLGFLGTIVGGIATGVATLALYALGAIIAFTGLNSVGETNIWVSLLFFVAGIGVIAGADKIISSSYGELFEELSYCFGAVFVICVGIAQRKKIREPYGNGTKFAVRLKILAWVLCLSLILSGVIVFAGSFLELVNCVPNVAEKIRSIGGYLYLIGMISWLMRTGLVLKALKASGRSINSFQGEKSSGGKSSSTVKRTAGGADLSKVRAEMQSLATYFSGGFDSPCSGESVQIKYRVTVSVEAGKIDFTLYCSLTGTYSPSSEKAVVSNTQSLIKKRANLVLSRAEKRLNEIGPDSSYSISVKPVAE